MKLHCSCLFGLFASVCLLCAAVDTGAKAPEFTLMDTTGASHSLSDFKGKYVVLEWTNHRCPFVVKHYSKGDMQATQKEFINDGAFWLQIVSSAPGKQGHVTAAEGESLRESLKMSSTAMLLDESGSVGRAYDARTTPHMYLISPEGTLIYQGAIDSIKSTRQTDIAKATNYVKAAYWSVKNGEPIENSRTKAYGCGVKF